MRGDNCDKELNPFLCVQSFGTVGTGPALASHSCSGPSPGTAERNRTTGAKAQQSEAADAVQKDVSFLQQFHVCRTLGCQTRASHHNPQQLEPGYLRFCSVFVLVNTPLPHRGNTQLHKVLFLRFQCLVH